MKEYAFINVQCRTDEGELGVFLTRQGGAIDRKPISPVFKSLHEFFPWAHEQGWQLSCYPDGVYSPWLMAREAVPA